MSSQATERLVMLRAGGTMQILWEPIHKSEPTMLGKQSSVALDTHGDVDGFEIPLGPLDDEQRARVEEVARRWAAPLAARASFGWRESGCPDLALHLLEREIYEALCVAAV